VQFFTYEEINLGFSHVSAYLQQHRKRQDMTHVTLKLMKVNLPVHEVCTTISMNKKEVISFTVVAPAEFHPPVVKNMVLTLFQGHFS